MPADRQHSAVGGWQQLAPGTEATDPSLPHVLLVVDTFPRSLGGGERVVLRLARLLPSFGFRVSLLTFSIDSASSFQPPQSPCPLYLLPLEKTYDMRALRGAFALARFLHREHVVLVQTFFESSDIWAGTVTRLLSSAKLIWSRRDMGILRGRKHQLAYRWLRRLPHGVHAVSEGVRRHAVEVDGVKPDRVFTVYNGLDLEGFRPAAVDTPKRQLLVLTIGNIRRVKGHDIFLQAAALVHKILPETQFAIAGEVLEPSFHSELLALRANLGLANCFHFPGGVSDLATALHAADVFVLPSRSEGFSNSLIEAMACALPVVATDVGGNAEAMQHDVTGLVVPPEDHVALADALVRLLLSPKERRAMGEAGRARVEAEFTNAAMLSRLTAAYHDILCKRAVTQLGYQR